MKELEKLRKIANLAKLLCNKLSLIDKHPAYLSVFQIYQSHGFLYNGPNYNIELENLKRILEEEE
jgi:hypothetical protein